MRKKLKPSQLKAYHTMPIVIRPFLLLLRILAVYMARSPTWRRIDMGVVCETFRSSATANKATPAGVESKAKWRRKGTLVTPHDISTIDVLACCFK